ncbi:MAG: hypothetical protein ACU0B1_16480 [Thermohalobaculum sp.]
MSVQSDNGDEARLDLSNMPGSFHPAATWIRLTMISISILGIELMKPIAYYYYNSLEEYVILLVYSIGLVCIILFISFYSLSIENWFPRPESTRSWSSRVAIGWNLRLCEIEADGLRGILRWRTKGQSRKPNLLLLFVIVGLLVSQWAPLFVSPIIAVAFAILLGDEMRRLADTMAKTDPRVAALMY